MNYEAARTEVYCSVLQKKKASRYKWPRHSKWPNAATKTFLSKFTPKVYQVKVSMCTQKVYSVKSQCSVNKLSPQCLHHQFSLLTNQESSLLGRFANPPILSSPSFHKPSCADCEQADSLMANKALVVGFGGQAICEQASSLVGGKVQDSPTLRLNVQCSLNKLSS